MATQKKPPELRTLQGKFDSLRKRLASLGPILVGTITERTILRDDPNRPGEKKSFGPYHQWTFKEAGKTVTVNLTQTRSKPFKGPSTGTDFWKIPPRKCGVSLAKSSMLPPWA